MTNSSGVPEACIQAAAEAAYLDWFKPAQLAWAEQADEMRDAWRSGQAAALAAALAVRDDQGEALLYVRDEATSAIEWYCRHCDVVWTDDDDLQWVQPDGHFACPTCEHDDLVSGPAAVFRLRGDTDG